MSTLLSAELSATCNALGTFDKKSGKYLIDEYTLNTVKDLIRYLRRDGEDHEIRIHFGQTKVLQTDLLPMLIDHWDNTELFDVTLRLLVNLTNPALLLFREEVPTERNARHNYLQILSHLQSYKEETFTKVETWNIFAKKLAKVLEIDWSERDEDTGLIIERILILIRNVLHVPADLDHERRPENDASIHDQVLWALNQSGILDIILYMTSENEKQYFMHILEIISHLLREQNPTALADSALHRSVDEKLRDEQELLSMRMAENLDRNNKIRQYSSSRHSRFGGTYVVQNMKSITDNEIICLKPLNKISSLDFGTLNKKEKFVKPKNRRPVESGILERRSAFAVRLFLKEFCIEFLNGSYNPMMRSVKDILVRAKAQQNDESYYLWAVKFFLEFNRGHNFQVGLVSETMSIEIFHYVQQQMEKYLDMIKMEKKKFGLWVRRLHLGLRAYKELLQTLKIMDLSPQESVKESAKVLKSNIFYILEYREFILSAIMAYDENKMPRSYLVDLMETVHLYLKMLEHYCKKTGLVVQKKVRKKSKAKKTKPKSKPSQKQVSEVTFPSWEEVRAQIAVVMTGSFQNYPPPFDAASETPIEEQKEDCMKNIQKMMRNYKFEDAIGTLRAAREVWPEEGIFGDSDISEVEELTMLESIYAADLGVEIIAQVNKDNEEEEYSENEDDEDEEEVTKSTSLVETDFDFQDFVQRFCQPRVVSACVFLLEKYDKNLPQLNHCIVKMLHRITWDCKKPSMAFQATLFLIFQKILKNPNPIFKELKTFAIFILRKFTDLASENPKLFIELLFWKSSKETYEIEHGYSLYKDSKPGKGSWSEEQEEELRQLYMENQRNPETDKDVIDWIMENVIDQTRTRRSIIIKLKELGLIFKAPTKKSNIREKIPKEFGEDEDELLRKLWNTYSETKDPLCVIIPRMPRKRPKSSYIDRLIDLGIISDKKECRKKRTKKSDGKSENNKSDSERSDDSDSGPNSSDSGDDRKSILPKPSKKAKKIKKNVSLSKNISKTKNKESNAPTLSANAVAKLLIDAVENDMTEALKWLAENLEEVALDQEAEGFDPQGEGIPIVPISSVSIEAMDNHLFNDILKGLGVKPPSDEQEMYWRIPSNLHYETLRNRREIIIKAIEKTLVIDSENIEKTADETNVLISNNNEFSNLNDENSSDDDLFEKLRKQTNNLNAVKTNRFGKRDRSLESDEENSRKIARIEEEIEPESDILAFTKKTLAQDIDDIDTEDILSEIRKKTRLLDDSDASDSDEDMLPAKNTQKKRLRVINDDSE